MALNWVLEIGDPSSFSLDSTYHGFHLFQEINIV